MNIYDEHYEALEALGKSIPTNSLKCTRERLQQNKR